MPENEEENKICLEISIIVLQKHQTKAEKVETAQDQHEKAIFGPAWMNKEIKKEEGASLPPLPSTLTASTRQGPPLLHSNVNLYNFSWKMDGFSVSNQPGEEKSRLA